jgi:hypothetical protein
MARDGGKSAKLSAYHPNIPPEPVRQSILEVPPGRDSRTVLSTGDWGEYERRGQFDAQIGGAGFCRF